uniref:Uncharacterized protein n=1 Tax=Anguilla anguilla TaxID=7936 RepID=A0A0E9QBC3_ANGAN
MSILYIIIAYVREHNPGHGTL